MATPFGPDAFWVNVFGLPANNAYKSSLSSCSEGFSYTEEEIRYVDEVISPLVMKKQSLYHICVTQADKLICSQRTLYSLIEQGVFSVRNIDLPRKVRYRPRRRNKPLKVDKSCRINRNYEDFKSYIALFYNIGIGRCIPNEIKGNEIHKRIFTL